MGKFPNLLCNLWSLEVYMFCEKQEESCRALPSSSQLCPWISAISLMQRETFPRIFPTNFVKILRKKMDFRITSNMTLRVTAGEPLVGSTWEFPEQLDSISLSCLFAEIVAFFFWSMFCLVNRFCFFTRNNPLDTGCKWSLFKTFRRCPGHLSTLN